MTPKRYRWAKRSEVYHDLNYSVERCNIDDMVGFEESDELPQVVTAGRYRRLCNLCRRHQEQIQGVV